MMTGTGNLGGREYVQEHSQTDTASANQAASL
jgi:hypothetical protein